MAVSIGLKLCNFNNNPFSTDVTLKMQKKFDINLHKITRSEHCYEKDPIILILLILQNYLNLFQTKNMVAFLCQSKKRLLINFLSIGK